VRRPRGHLNYLTTQFGKPFTVNGFGNWFTRRCREAGLPHCSSHGLRKGGATIAAENGASDRQLMAIYGWTTTKKANVYTKKASDKKLATDAMPLINLGQSENETSTFTAGGVGIKRGKGVMNQTLKSDVMPRGGMPPAERQRKANLLAALEDERRELLRDNPAMRHIVMHRRAA
jgi:hypothetical protein